MNKQQKAARRLQLTASDLMAASAALSQHAEAQASEQRMRAALTAFIAAFKATEPDLYGEPGRDLLKALNKAEDALGAART